METKTINLRDVPEDLVRRAKAYAALRGLSLKDFILSAIQQALESAGPALASSISFFARAGKGPKGKGRKRL